MQPFFSVDIENKKVELTFRSGDLSARQREAQTKRSSSDLHKGEKVDGIIKRVENYGLFIQIEGTKLSGLCHKSEVCLQIFRVILILTNCCSFQTTRMPTLAWHFKIFVKVTV
jgi:polyribonucleotide nucleotidyltransferase